MSTKTSQPATGTVLGFVHSDGTGQVTHAGLGSDPAIRALVGTEDWMENLIARRIVALRLNAQDLVLAYAALPAGWLVLVHNARSQILHDFLASVDFAYDILEHILSDPFDAMTVVDAEARLRYISPVHEKFFGLRPGEYVGKPVRQIIENTRLDRVVESGKAEVAQLQRMKGVDRVVTRSPIKRDGKILGAIGRVMFKNPTQLDDLNRKINSLEGELEFYRRETAALRKQDHGLDDIIGTSPAMQHLKDSILQVAPLDVSVLILGESGVGKELVAQAIHRLSPRRDNAHVIVNSAALPGTLVESELFGYNPGAFTGAHHKGRAGKFEQAHQGTIFLDEIGDMSMEVQAKLLRVIQEGTVERLGSEKPMKLDFRLVTATHRDLQAMIAANQFRLDLFYRISPLVLEVPPLRERREDIAPLARHFARAFAERHDRQVVDFDASAIAYLEASDWPGNIRQLKHEIERALILFKGSVLSEAHLNGTLRRQMPVAAEAVAAPVVPVDGPLQAVMDRTERMMIEAAMKQFGGNKKKVAEQLQISRSYLYKRLAALGLEDTDGAE